MLVKPITDVIGYIDIAAPRLPKLRPNQILQAQVLKTLPEGKVQIRMLGLVWEVKSQVALQEGERLLLQVQEGNEKSCMRLCVIKDEKECSFLSTPLAMKPKAVVNAYNLKQQNTIVLQEIYADLFKASKRIKKSLQTIGHKAPELIAKLEKLLFLQLDAKGLQDLLGKGFGENIEKLLDSLENLEHKYKDAQKDLHQIQELLQNYLLLSQLGGAIIYFVPILWDEVEDSEIVIKQLRRYNISMCRLYLRFVDNDEVRVTLLLRKNYLQIFFGVRDEHFKEEIIAGIASLKQNFISSGLYVDIVVDDFYKELLDRSFFLDESFVDKKI